MINILETVEVNFIVSVFRALSGWLDSIVYSLVQLLFNIFFAVSETTINDTIVYEIFNRVGLIIGVFMLFVIGFNLITYIINPDMISDKKRGTGNLIFRIIISVVLLASVNSLFTFARRFEVAVVNSNFIGKVITGNDSSFSQSIDNGSIGNFFSAEVFFSFLSCKSSDCQGEMSAYSIENLKKFVSTADSFWILPNYVNLQDTGKNYLYEYKTIWSTITGILMIYILCNYVLSIGVRVIQLAYLQLIAPIPILFNILPNGEDKLKKWGKQAFTTYLDLFLRLIIIYLVLFFMTNVFSTDSLFIYSDKATDFMTMVKIVIMLGLMMFAKKAPDLIKELFPSSGAASGDFGLSLKKRMSNMLGAGVLGGAIGAGGALIVGGIGAGIGNAINAKQKGMKWYEGVGSVLAGFGSGAVRGVRAGYKNGLKGGLGGIFGAGTGAWTAASRARNARAVGYGIDDKVVDKFTDYAGITKSSGTTSEITDRIKAYDEQIANLRRDENAATDALRTLKSANNAADFAKYDKVFARTLKVDADGKPILGSGGEYQYDYTNLKFVYDAAGNIDWDAMSKSGNAEGLTAGQLKNYYEIEQSRDRVDNEARKLEKAKKKLSEAADQAHQAKK